jgi:hypothetical protein
MVLVLNGPIWFRGFESLFIFAGGLITLLITLLSYKAYRITQERKFKYFSLAFLSMSLSFVIVSIFTTILITHVSEKLYYILGGFDYIFFLHILLALVGYILLLIVTLKIQDKITSVLLLTLTTLLTLFSYQHFLKFHIISFILLLFLSYQFYMNYLEKKNPNAKLVFTSFYLLTAAQAFIIVSIYIADVFYVIGRVLQVLGFLLLFYTFLQVVTNNGGKKRKA